MSSSAILFALCKVALDTTVPARAIDLNSATGVTAPVRPIWNVSFVNFVGASYAGYLRAMAHLGAFWVIPIAFCMSKFSIFITTPSVAYGRERRLDSQ